MSSFYDNLEVWVKRQKEIKELFMKAEENYAEADRLTLITLSRLAFQHMEKTIEAFDNWLKDPMITTHMPRELLVELWGNLREIFYKLIELDIEHTSKFAEHLKKLESSESVNPLFTLRISREEKETRRQPPTPII
ncbi:MAG: DUF2153 family protein [Desulfurococcaceae archaeon]|jgi:hypothetical protein